MKMAKAIPVTVTTPSGYTMTVRSIRATARMLSGYGTESGGFRNTISLRALNGAVGLGNNVVRRNAVAG
jgi:hypothetical protein